MRTSIISSAAVCVAAVTWLTAASAAERTMTADACQPLTDKNLEACCADANWKELVLSEDARFCPPLSANDRDSGRRGDALATNTGNGGTTTPGGGGGGGGGTDPDTTGSIPGNPGNQMAVGGAGEKGKDNESPVKTGDRGNSN